MNAVLRLRKRGIYKRSVCVCVCVVWRVGWGEKWARGISHTCTHAHIHSPLELPVSKAHFYLWGPSPSKHPGWGKRTESGVHRAP